MKYGRTFNFSAGPAMMPEPVLEEIRDEMMNYRGSGMCVMEMSHRSKVFQQIADEAQADLRKLMNIPDNYKVLFIQGGGTLQFAMVAMNLMKNGKACYVETGAWSKKAIAEAKKYGEVQVVASSADKNFSYIPKNYVIPADAEYFHVTTNNTIFGTEIRKELDSPIPMIADMSSDILSRPVDVSKYICIYGGAQKNLAPAGVTFAIVKEDALGKVTRTIPTMLDYRTHIKEGSMFNTPPVLPVYSAMLTLRWLKAQGGVKEMDRRAHERADMLYDVIDKSRIFTGTAATEDRSLMNIDFVMKEEYKELEPDFLAYAVSQGMVGIKGHRSIGGFRASCYNAMPLESVKALIACMNEFEQKH